MEELTADECRALLEASSVAHLGVVEESRPYVSPVSYVVVDDKVCLRTGPGRRMDAIRANPQVCLEVSRFDDDTGDWESVIVWGEAFEIDDPQLAERVLSDLVHKYSDAIGSPLSRGGGPPLPDPAILVGVPIETMTGRSSGKFFSIRTRPGRL